MGILNIIPLQSPKGTPVIPCTPPESLGSLRAPLFEKLPLVQARVGSKGSVQDVRLRRSVCLTPDVGLRHVGHVTVLSCE